MHAEIYRLYRKTLLSERGHVINAICCNTRLEGRNERETCGPSRHLKHLTLGVYCSRPVQLDDCLPKTKFPLIFHHADRSISTVYGRCADLSQHIETPPYSLRCFFLANPLRTGAIKRTRASRTPQDKVKCCSM